MIYIYWCIVYTVYMRIITITTDFAAILSRRRRRIMNMPIPIVTRREKNSEVIKVPMQSVFTTDDDKKKKKRFLLALPHPLTTPHLLLAVVNSTAATFTRVVKIENNYRSYAYSIPLETHGKFPGVFSTRTSLRPIVCVYYGGKNAKIKPCYYTLKTSIKYYKMYFFQSLLSIETLFVEKKLLIWQIICKSPWQTLYILYYKICLYIYIS